MFIFKPDPDFYIQIAITIPIKNLIRINNDPVFIVRSDPGIHQKKGSTDIKNTGQERPGSPPARA